YIAANCYPCITILDYPERFTTATDDAAKAAIRDGTRARLHHHWDLFADQFKPADDRFLAGDRRVDPEAARRGGSVGVRGLLELRRRHVEGRVDRDAGHGGGRVVDRLVGAAAAGRERGRDEAGRQRGQARRGRRSGAAMRGQVRPLAKDHAPGLSARAEALRSTHSSARINRSRSPRARRVRA
ncbi:MAG TPA: hypothetical protein VIP05_01895, partial [Burkholderiaceae bacterium]